MDDDNLFASLGNSLMRDLLTDIEGPNNLDSLANLEKELDDINDSTTSSAFMSNAPPGISSGAIPSAGAMVVGHATQSYTDPSLPSSPQDAFAKSLQQFSALSLADDFLKADSARKHANEGSIIQDLEAKKNEEMLIQNLFEDEEDYDVQAASEKVTGDNMAKLFSGLASAAGMSGGKTNVTESEPPRQQQQQQQPSNNVPPPPLNPPLGGSGPMRHPPMNMAPPMIPGPSGPMMMGMPPPGSMPPPQMMMGMPPPHMIPPGSAPPPHVMMMMQQQMQQQAAMQHQLQRQQRGPPPPSVSESKFTNSDFPALGAKESDVEKERLEEAKRMEEERIANASRQNDRPSMNVYRRITFANPNPDAPPVPATAIRCTSMTPRDLCYVLHSMMRPILSFSTVLDAYNADYYRWSYEDRKSQNLLFVGRPTPSFQNNLPTPVWKETKVKAQEMEESHRDKLEKRAENWTKEKQALGRVVKLNVKRPKALLSTSTLSTSADGKLDELMAEQSEEDRQRALLWSARLAIDKGYQAYLNLIELRRLLQSRPSDALMEEEERKQTLLKDVEQNVTKLQSAFGLKTVDGGTVECGRKILSKTLTLSKGRMLLSRVIDEGILPHASACKVLPSAIAVVFEFASTSDLTVAAPAGEERLLRSLTGLVKTVRPSVDSQNLLACLISATDAEAVMIQKNRSMKSVLTSKRTLMELLHAIFERGSVVCVGDVEAEWKDRETKFLAILAKS
jgi:hypothetical protein